MINIILIVNIIIIIIIKILINNITNIYLSGTTSSNITTAFFLKKLIF